MTGSTDGMAATRLPLDPGPQIDPFALAGARGILFHTGDRVRVGLGAAATIPLPHGFDSDTDLRRASEQVAAIPCDDRWDPAVGAVVGFGALPFDRSAAGALVVPQVTYGSDRGREWVTVVGTPGGSGRPPAPDGLRSWLAAAQTAADAEGGHDGTDRLSVVPRSSDASFLAMVAEALSAIGRGDLVKVVLARHVEVTAEDAIDVPGLLRRWHGLEPSCTIFSLPTTAGQFVGASPELLVERSGLTVVSRPLAGTAERFTGGGGSLLPGALLESAKDAIEHRLVVEAIVDALGPLCSELDVPSRPDLVHLHNLVHLGTSLRGTLARQPDGSFPDSLRLVAALHPTPAVGGVPVGTAREMIRRLEPEPRGHYAGPVGYVDARGDGRWMVGIRAMTIAGRSARLTAGVGIVDGSEPDVELVETNLKLTAVLDALAPGVEAASSAGAHQTVAT